ncbi:Kiwa anti-phage protein KwaB-like domain-containing protein [Gemella morbillorum]|mgnify:CR=1 FL=1|jgi:hypothetical protein|uniref:Kiwa anti-phage protein KwaB-like domain-containing protein n=1 Tax=Gemella morbillorum TaxID=29391 RepID=UPI0028D33477|nr:Kiwa anti-phage protein KwaB-like domain-containing protein [Gemella morbillorum]
MTIKKLKDIFLNIKNCDAWSLQILQIKSQKEKINTYTGREIELTPSSQLIDGISDIADRYISGKDSLENKYDNVEVYQGNCDARTIYKIDTDNVLISEEYGSFIEAISNPDVEVDPLSLDSKAYVLKGDVMVKGKLTPIKLISMKRPIITLKKKYSFTNGTFKEISDKVFSLKSSVDIVIIENVLYMLTISGENLFSIDRAYKINSEKHIDKIIKSKIVANEELFENRARSEYNPRRFMMFDEKYLEKLSDVKTRREISKKFNIKLINDKFDTSKAEEIDKLIKLLCRKGAVSPFDSKALEVSNSKNWK